MPGIWPETFQARYEMPREKFALLGRNSITMRAQLVPLDGTQPIDLTKELTLVGRKEDCDLRLVHKSVSKMHCVIVRTEGLLLLRDLGSTNGTRVNGQRVRRAALLPNDQLTIASYKFRIHFGADEAPVRREERTEQLDADEVAHLLGKGGPTPLSDSGHLPAFPLQSKPLPDVYPDGPGEAVR
jgi:predicted component of type VI protein secretion system